MLVLIFSCTSTDEPASFYQITTVVPFSHSFYSDVPKVADADGNIYRFTDIEYDTIQKRTVFIYDSIPGDTVTVSYFSLLTNNQERTFNLECDTRITFDTTAYSYLIKGEAKDVLVMQTEEIDTLFIGFYSSGCSSPFLTKIKAFKVYTNYTVVFSDLNGTKETTYDVSQSLFEDAFTTYQKDCKKLFPKVSAGSMHTVYSTTITTMFMRIGNILYEFPRFSQWDGYETFCNTITGRVHTVDAEPKPEDHTWDAVLVK